MKIDPHVALSALTSALEEHLNASLNRRSETDPAVESAFNSIEDAFLAYEDALFAGTGEVTPLDLYDEDEEDDLDEQMLSRDDTDDDGDVYLDEAQPESDGDSDSRS